MNTMTFVLGDALQVALAKRCAELIHAQVVHRRLCRCGFADTVWPPFRSDASEVGAMFRALPARSRREMRGLVKLYLNELFAAHGTCRRWQDYVRTVAACRGLPVPFCIDDPAWDGFVLREKQKAAA